MDEKRSPRLPPRISDRSGEIDEEVAFHLEARAARLVGEGMTEDEARREALRRFGNVHQVKAAMTREQRLSSFRRGLSWLLDDVRGALRGLRRRPAFASTVVTTLALGIGAVTAVFTLVDGVLLAPLPFPQAERLVAVEHSGRSGELEISPSIYTLYRDEATALEAIGMVESGAANLVFDGRPERVGIQFATAGFFEALGVEPALGRIFSEDEGEVRQYGSVIRPASDPLVVISDGLWRDVLGADPDVIGRTLDIDGTPREVIAVMPPGFGHPDRNARMWIPLTVDPASANPFEFSYAAVGRLAPGTSLEAAAVQLDALRDRILDLPNGSMSPALWESFNLHPSLSSLKESVVGNAGATLWILLGSVGFLLLVACANVANLILVQADARRREQAIRRALGAGRARVTATFLAEGLALAVLGGLGGLLIATLAVQGALATVPTDLPRMDEIGIDLRVLGVAGAVSLLCAALFALTPLVHSQRGAEATTLGNGGARGSTEDSDRGRIRMGLVVLQTALALVLLAGSGLMLRSFQELRRIEPGFDPADVLTARVDFPETEMPGSEAAEAFLRDVRDRLSRQPGVEAVGLAFSVPLNGGPSPSFDYAIEDEPRGPTDPVIQANHNFIGGAYFEAMGIEILEGRPIGADDGARGTRSVVVSRSLAEDRWPAQSPLGRRVAAQGGWYTIVGVADDVRYEALTEPPPAMIYWPQPWGSAEAPEVVRSLSIVMRTNGDALGYSRVLTREVAAANPRIALSSIRTLADIHRRASSRTSFTLALLAVSAGTALFLGLVGIYGVVSYAASKRTREIGIRVALGASRGQVRRLVVRGGLIAASLGVAVGLVAGAALGSLMESVLFGVNGLDPLTFALAALAVLGVALGASWVPAARAASIEPTRALRTE